MTPSFWRGQKVFVTGHTGFKGGWMSLWLSTLGAKVSGFAKDPATTPQFFELANLKNHLAHDTRGDIADGEALTKAMQAAQPSVVFHMAAQPLVRLSFREPVETYTTNVMGTINLLEACRKTPSVQAIVIITTDKVYENKEWMWPYREDDALGGYDPYASSKACAEIVTRAWQRSFFTSGPRIATVRAGNVIGGGDWSEDRIIPDAIRSVAAGKTLSVRRPEAIRPWQHVLEPVCGYMTVAEGLVARKEGCDQAFNFGPSDSDVVPVGDLLSTFQEAWGEGFNWKIERDPNALHEATFLRLDSSKARQILKWEPALTLPKALKMTADWYRTALAEPAQMPALTLEQIKTYETLIEARK